MSSSREWARAFAKQAEADFTMFSRLSTVVDAPPCHRLHFLQMTCEKLAKGHLYASGSIASTIQSSHGTTVKQIPLILDAVYSREAYNKRGSSQSALRKWMLGEFKKLATEIAYLSPSVPRDGSRPDNCEYPWETRLNIVVVPAEHDLPELDLVRSHAAREMLKLLPLAIHDILAQVS